MTALRDRVVAYHTSSRRNNGTNSDRFAAALPGIVVLKRPCPGNIEGSVYDPVVCLILQGEKTVSSGTRTVTVAAGQALLVSHDLPVISKITRASPDEPYLALIVLLDYGILRGLYQQVGDSAPMAGSSHSLVTCAADRSWIEPVCRYLALANSPLDADVLGPAIRREIHFRLLMSPIGRMLRNLLAVDSHASRIARAIAHIRQGFREPVAVSDLARLAAMSPSSFHGHFKAVTGTTPLQFQKDLRIIEARRLMIEEGSSVTAASYAVGYESPTQFSREYSRRFGLSPGRDTRAPAAT